MKKRVFLNRFYKDARQSLGILVTQKIGAELFICKTLELPEGTNEPKKECIPAGKYICKETYSPRYNDTRYEVLGVPGRSGIRFDVANFAKQLLGCICLGDAHKDINADGDLDTIHSGDTVKAFLELMDHQEFELIIS